MVASGEDVDNEQTFLSHLPFPDLNFLFVKHHVCKVFFSIVNFSFFHSSSFTHTSFIFLFFFAQKYDSQKWSYFVKSS